METVTATAVVERQEHSYHGAGRQVSTNKDGLDRPLELSGGTTLSRDSS
jgi:hypothetical protein